MKQKSNRKKNQRIYNSEIFTNIYNKNLWGGKKGEFYSGTGSHNIYVDDYAQTISKFIKDNNIKHIVEIGCGDFNVTNKILCALREFHFNFHYTGYDVVKELITRNRLKYSSPDTKFVCKDSCTGKISSGDLLIVRQVLQHLDNRSIKKIIDKFIGYKYVIVSEHQPSKSYKASIVPNIDKITDGANRVQVLSGVYLELEPFNCKIDSLIHSIREATVTGDAQINTFLLKMS